MQNTLLYYWLPFDCSVANLATKGTEFLNVLEHRNYKTAILRLDQDEHTKFPANLDYDKIDFRQYLTEPNWSKALKLLDDIYSNNKMDEIFVLYSTILYDISLVKRLLEADWPDLSEDDLVRYRILYAPIYLSHKFDIELSCFVDDMNEFRHSEVLPISAKVYSYTRHERSDNSIRPVIHTPFIEYGYLTHTLDVQAKAVDKDLDFVVGFQANPHYTSYQFRKRAADYFHKNLAHLPGYVVKTKQGGTNQYLPKAEYDKLVSRAFTTCVLPANANYCLPFIRILESIRMGTIPIIVQENVYDHDRLAYTFLDYQTPDRSGLLAVFRHHGLIVPPERLQATVSSLLENDYAKYKEVLNDFYQSDFYMRLNNRQSLIDQLRKDLQ